jgi:hypothetical protein
MSEPRAQPNVESERRHALRVPVRRIVRAAVGLRSFEALLIDLSVSGCRLRCPEPVTAHGSLWVVIPAGFGGRFPVPVRGEVARAESVRGEPTGVCDVALRFRDLSPRAVDRLAAAVGQVLSPPHSNPNGERRRSRRRWFGTRVVAGGPGHPRVLLARDLSAGGMQVENATDLVKGAELQLALYSQAGGAPLLLRGRVVRCDARGEAAFEFLAPTDAQREHLAQLLASLPAVDAPVVAEVLERSA